MYHWGIYIAYAWLATIIWAFTDAVQAIHGWSILTRRNQPFPTTIVCDLEFTWSTC